MSNINFKEFIWFDLGPKPPEMVINVSETGGFTFNRPAREALPPHIKIGILPDGKMAVAPLTDRESGSVIRSNDLMSQK